ncbi:putative zinc transporter msc2 [Loxospora ochrophaea]|nr:putative zinc transporter msc2 [Loxospora ochrophaea]
MALFNPTAATQQKLQQSSPVESAAVNHARLVLDDSVEVHAFDAVPRPGFLSACALTSMTLLIVGAVGKLQKKPTTRGRSGSALGPRGEVAKNQAQVLSAVGARRILARTASIGLPFYAAEKLGGDRVGLVTLVTLAADLMNVESEGINLTTVEGWKRVLAFRRWTLAVLSVQVFCDVFGITNNIEMTSAWMGYLALALSVFAFPPPFLTTKLKKSSASTEGSASTGKISESTDASWKDSLAALGISLSNVRASPILSTPGDVQLTLASGVAVAGLLLLFLLFPQYSASPFFIRSFGSVDIVAPCALALSILTAQPQALRSEKKIGLVVGSFVSIVLPKFFGSTSWIPFACQGVFLVAFWLATTSDTHLQFSNLARPQQHPGKPQHEHSDKNSRLTEFLLYTFRDWPLWHSIISERDSRRIFYFMR